MNQWFIGMNNDSLTKICRSCGDEKSLNDFYRHPGTKDGRFGKCISCFRAYRKTLYQAVNRRESPKVSPIGRWAAVR